MAIAQRESKRIQDQQTLPAVGSQSDRSDEGLSQVRTSPAIIAIIIDMHVRNHLAQAHKARAEATQLLWSSAPHTTQGIPAEGTNSHELEQPLEP
jgi:hypothetical protein